MKNKILDRIAIGVFVALLVGSLWINWNISNSTPKDLTLNDELEWYRTKDLPEDCRLPEYEGDIEKWKKNLRHNQELWYCLKYFE